MGASLEYYRNLAPYKSFIHVEEFSSIKDLADYLLYLDKNDEEYNSYFQWKGTGESINTYFFCRLCGMLHANLPHKHYDDVGKWWNDGRTCHKPNYQ